MMKPTLPNRGPRKGPRPRPPCPKPPPSRPRPVAYATHGPLGNPWHTLRTAG